MQVGCECKETAGLFYVSPCSTYYCAVTLLLVDPITLGEWRGTPISRPNQNQIPNPVFGVGPEPFTKSVDLRMRLNNQLSSPELLKKIHSVSLILFSFIVFHFIFHLSECHSKVFHCLCNNFVWPLCLKVAIL